LIFPYWFEYNELDLSIIVIINNLDKIINNWLLYHRKIVMSFIIYYMSFILRLSHFERVIWSFHFTIAVYSWYIIKFSLKSNEHAYIQRNISVSREKKGSKLSSELPRICGTGWKESYKFPASAGVFSLSISVGTFSRVRSTSWKNERRSKCAQCATRANTFPARSAAAERKSDRAAGLRQTVIAN